MIITINVLLTFAFVWCGCGQPSSTKKPTLKRSVPLVGEYWDTALYYCTASMHENRTTVKIN
jgi:hypothetical protein